MSVPFVSCLLVLCAACLSAQGQTVLFDFETAADLKVWHYENRDASTPVREASLEPGFATSGKLSLVFSSPRWQPGLGEWPAFECRPPITDWSPYDRLAFDATNPTAFDQRVHIFISDSKHATRDGLLVSTLLPAYGWAQTVVLIADLAKHGLNPADIRVMHMFTERPPGDMVVHLDRFVLLKAGEPLPVPSAEYLQAFAALQSNDLQALDQAFDAAQGQLAARMARAPRLRPWVEGEMAALRQRLAAYGAGIRKADAAVLTAGEQRSRLVADLERLQAAVALRARFEAVRGRTQVNAEAARGLVVGFASSMEKVLPRAGVPNLTVSAHPSLRLARREKEALQVIVLPCEGDVKQVRVQVSDLVSGGGKLLAAGNVDTDVVGYVQTKAVPPYGSSHVGWWPDPILSFQHEADIARGDAQAFWVRVHAPADQPAGVYEGKLNLLVQGRVAFAFDLAVRVYGFSVPAASPLPLAVTFSPAFFEPDGSGGWREGAYKFPSWQKHKLQWGDMLADYYLSYDSLYHSGQPDFEVLDRVRGQGRLGRFNLGYYGACGASEQEIAAWKASTLPRIRKGYEEAKARGLLSLAYIYGCDENPRDMFPAVERAAALLKHEFPGVTVMTTTYDNTYGQASVIKSMDAFCPLTPSFNPDVAAEARAKGKQVWWYTCCGPLHPNLNTFVEYPAIEGRLLMGAMAAKYRPDGYLYYQISIWNSGPITRGPFTDWDPRSWTTYHGDGSWTCVGPDGTPLPTVRLENFRDGLEDYAYVRTLEATIARVEASAALAAAHSKWLSQAKRLLEVPATVLRDKTNYTHDPRALYRWRDAVAEAIESAPAAPAYPW